jgi:hypothetical protein
MKDAGAGQPQPHSQGGLNAASLWRLAIARRIGAAYAANPNVAAVIVGGSTARGHADRYSDIELGVFWHRPPTEDERLAAAQDAGAYVHRLYPYDPEEEVWSDDLFVGHRTPGQPTTGVLIEIPHYTADFIERVLADVLERYDTSDDKQNLISAILAAIPVSGEKLVDGWRARAAVYPRGLAVAMVQRYAQIDHFWRTEMFQERSDNILLFYETLVQVSRKLLYVLLALNSIYYSGFKWIHLQIAAMQTVPPDFQRRLTHVFRAEPGDAAREMHALVEETYTLIESAMPEVDVDKLRRIFRYSREPWDEAPTE